jgi:hypothetical protein
MNGAQVGVLKQPNQVGFRGFLEFKSGQGSTLISLVVNSKYQRIRYMCHNQEWMRNERMPT